MERLESLDWSTRVLWSEYHLLLERLVYGEKWHARLSDLDRSVGVEGWWNCEVVPRDAACPRAAVGSGQRGNIL